MSFSLEKLRTITDEELIGLHDATAIHTQAGVQYYLDEIARRENAKQTEQMMTLNMINQLGDESPDANRFTISCECGDTIHITLAQGDEGKWVMQTLNSLRSHVESKHDRHIKYD